MTRPLLVLALYILLAVVMTFPLAVAGWHALISTDSNALNDSYLGVWIFGWQAHQLLLDPLHLFQGNIFYPFANTLAFSELILPGALMYLPLELASGNPILAYNLVVLAVSALSGFAMYLWALDFPLLKREGARRTGAAILAGLVFAFCNYKLGEIRHVQLLAAQFMPLTMLYLGRGLRTPTVRNGFLTALFFVLNALSSLYYAVFLAFAMLVYAAVDLASRRFRLTRGHVIYGVTAALMAGIALVPFVIPFLQVERAFGFTASRDPRLFAARPASYLATPGTNWLYGVLTRGLYVASKGQPLFPGLFVVGLALLGAIARRGREVVFLLLLAALGFVLSFGPVLLFDRGNATPFPHALPYYWLSLVVTPLKGLNAPARFAVLVMLALSLLAASGAAWLADRFPGRRGGLLVLAGALILLEYAAAPLPLQQVDVGTTLSPVYAYLASQPPAEPVVEVPMGQPTAADQDRLVEYTYNSVYHWQPLVNGYSSFFPAEYFSLVKDMAAFPSAATVARLKKWGAVFVVIHSDRIKNPAQARATLDTLAGIEHVRDFDEIWLYRIN